MTAAAPALHVGIAEHGKVCALRGDHVTALMHYREAMNLAVRNREPEVLSRHYLECALESLEQMGAYAEVLAYCERAIDHYRDRPPAHALTRLDLASIHQRKGLVLLKLGERAEAALALDTACRTVAPDGARLPLAETVGRWLKSALTIAPDRIVAEQVRQRYFSVRPDTVRPERAVPIPGAQTKSAQPGAARAGKDA